MTEVSMQELAPIRKLGKRNFPHLHNQQSAVTDKELQGRRYIPHGYGIDYEFRPHIQFVDPKYSAIGPDWSSCLRWLPSPKPATSESGRFVEIWPESWKYLRIFPELSRQTERHWILHPEGFDATLRCTFDGIHKSTEQSQSERSFFAGPKLLINKRNGFPAASPGDKSYKSVEYSPDFHKSGTTLPAVNFGANYKQKFDTFIPLLQPRAGLRKSFREKEMERVKEEDFQEVCALDGWRPATPLVFPLCHNSTHPSEPKATEVRNPQP